MVLYIENPKDVIRKPLELINKFDMVTGEKINIQKYAPLLYANNKISKGEIKEIIHLPFHQKE